MIIKRGNYLDMDCIICKNGKTSTGTDTLTFEMNGHLVIIREVPGDVCGNCGHFYISSDAAIEVQHKVAKAVKDGAELKILKYA